MWIKTEKQNTNNRMFLLTTLAPQIMVADLRQVNKTALNDLDFTLRSSKWIVTNQPYDSSKMNPQLAALLILVKNGENRVATYVWPEGTMFDQVFDANIKPEHSREKVQAFISDMRELSLSRTNYVEIALRLHQMTGEILSFAEPITQLNALRNLDTEQRKILNNLFGLNNPDVTEQESNEAILFVINKDRTQYLAHRKLREQEKHAELHQIGKQMEELNNRSNELRTELGLGGKMNLHFSITEEEKKELREDMQGLNGQWSNWRKATEADLPQQDLSAVAERHQYITQMKTCFNKLKERMPANEAANYVRNQLGLSNDCSPKLQTEQPGWSLQQDADNYKADQLRERIGAPKEFDISEIANRIKMLSEIYGTLKTMLGEKTACNTVRSELGLDPLPFTSTDEQGNTINITTKQGKLDFTWKHLKGHFSNLRELLGEPEAKRWLRDTLLFTDGNM